MAQDLNSYLSLIKDKCPETFIEINRLVKPKFEVTALAQKFEDRKEFPTLLFNSVENLRGEGDNKLVINLTLRDRMALALGLESSQVGMDYISKLEELFARPVEPVLVPKDDAPVRRIMKKGEEVDIGTLPITTHHEMDGGSYLTMMIVAKHPEWSGRTAGVHNVAFHRMEYKDKRELATMISPVHTLTVLKAYQERGLSCPVAIILGHHPLFLVGAAARPAMDRSEYNVIGGLLQEPLKLVASETLGDDFLVPAEAEIILEGEILTDERVTEGPFGEWTGYIGGQCLGYKINIDSMYSREDSILVDHFVGHRENHELQGSSWETDLYHRLKEAGCNVKAVHLPSTGAAGFIAYIQIKKIAEGDQWNAAMAAATIARPKLMVIVDEDVNIYDDSAVLNAVACISQPGVKTQLIKGLRGSVLDPAMEHPTMHNLMVIDATKPVDRPFMTRVKVPQDVLDRIKIENYLG
ncbi:UbiD family decarboxylase [Chloroflexota bacterium]